MSSQGKHRGVDIRHPSWNKSWFADLAKRRNLIMPRYFFHLSFGDRLLPDEEGVELASRSAARQEPLAVVRELSGSVANRWASWFLRVADRRGQFLSLPLGHPALELVSNDGPSSSTLTPTPKTTEEAYGCGRAAA